MTIWRIRTLHLAIALAAALGGWAHASDPPWPDPRPIARDTPAFRAPEDPPREPPDGTAEEPAAPEPEGPITLQDALALALMRNPELAVFSWEARAGEARALQAGKRPNPELDFRVYRLDVDRRNTLPDTERSRVVLSQVFELGKKRRRRVDLARAELDLAGWDYEAKRIGVATAVASRFVEVLGGQRRVESSTRFVEYFEKVREGVLTLVESGAVRGVEAHQVRRQVGLAQIELQRAESELAAARFGLAATWGSHAPQFSEAVGDLEQVTPVPDIGTVIGLARQSPALARWDAELARGEAELALAKARRVPDVTWGAGMRWEESSGGQDYLIDFEISLPLLDRKQGEVLEARYRMARARNGRKAAEAASSDEIAQLFYALVESEARWMTLRDEVLPAARATFEAQRLGFERAAAGNLGDLLDARRDLARVEIDLTDALVDYHGALAALEGVVGQSLAQVE